MDVVSFINNNGKKEIPNPKHNPRSKKNKEPKTITVDDLEPRHHAAVNLAVADAQRQFVFDEKKARKYQDIGINLNNWENVDRQLSKAQNAGSKWLNALAQAVVSEIILGTLKGLSDLVDMVGQVTGISDPNYSNPVSQFLEEKQEEFKNWAPVYVDKELNINNGGLIDAGWWASNIPSVASSLTLLLPSTYVVKGLSVLGKAAKASSFARKATRVLTGAERAVQRGQKLNKVQRVLNSASTHNAVGLFLENGTTAALSRAMENYQEARQTYNDMYVYASESLKKMKDKEYTQFLKKNGGMLGKDVDTSNRDEVAKAIAKTAADRTFQLDWINVVSDVIQIYGLRNAWKGMKNAPAGSAAVRRAEKDAAKYFGKSAEEIAALKAKRSFGEKAGEWIGDRLYGGKLVIAGELGEGVEEAINYMAQQEGMHLGKVLLGKEDKTANDESLLGNILSGFDGRIASYVKCPELWDAAFWGVLGGVVFQNLGSGFRRIDNKLTESKSDAQQEAKETLPWYQLDELPETKRRISEIQGRAIDFNNYKEKLQQINEGIDIYRSRQGETVHFENEVEQEAARQRLKNEFVAQMTLRAMNSGNFDMFREYLADENVRKGMIDAGILQNKEGNRTQEEMEADAKAYIDDALKTVDKVEAMYDQELVAVDAASAYLNARGKRRSGDDTSVPAEYMQIVAVNNVNDMLAVEGYNTELEAIEDRIAQLEEQFQDELDPNVDYRGNIRVGVLANELGRLRAERKRLVAEEGRSLSNSIAIAAIDKRIESIEDDLDGAALTWATFMSLRYTLTDDGKYIQEDTPEAFAYRDRLITQHTEDSRGQAYLEGLESFGLSERVSEHLDDAGVEQYHMLEQESRKTFSELKNISPELDMLYQRQAAVSKARDFIKNDIARTVDDVAEQVGMLHNTMNEARRKAIDQANGTIRELYRKYGAAIPEAIADKTVKIYNTCWNIDTRELSDTDRQSLEDAINVLQLTKSYNQSLAVHLDRMFDMEAAIAFSQEANNDDVEEGGAVIVDSEENATYFEYDTNTLADDTTVSSAESVESSREEESGQNGGVENTTSQPTTENRTPNFYTKFYTKRGKHQSGRFSSEDNGGVEVYDNYDGTYTLDVRGNARMLNDSRFFANADEVDLTRPYEVVSQPIASKNKKGKLEIVQQGELRNTDTLEVQQREEEVSQQEQPTETTTPISEESAETNVGESQTEEAAQLSSTGEGGNVDEVGQTVADEVSQTESTEKPSVPITHTADGELLNTQVPADDKMRNEALSRFQAEFKANHDVDLDAIADELIRQNIADGATKEAAQAAVNKSLELIKRVIEKRRNANAENTMRSTVDDIILSQSSLIERQNSPVETSAVKAYKDAVKNMMNQYAKELGIKKIAGKIYVNLEDLLRYANTQTEDKQVAAMIYQNLKEYLKTDEAKKDFIVMDSEQVDKSNFLDNVAKTAEERYAERLGDTTVQRVDIRTMIGEMTSDEEVAQFYEALDALEVGDELSYTVDNGRLTIRDVKGRKVGTMSIPKIHSKTGAFVMVNDGWKYNILNENGAISSPLKTFFQNILSPNKDLSDGTKARYREIAEIVYELAYTKPSTERKNELLAKFAANPIISMAKNSDLIGKDAKNTQLINGLVKLFRFVNGTGAMSSKARDIAVKSSINQWFKKLDASYTAVSAMAAGQNYNISVATISDGELIRIVENDKIQADKQALPASEAIAGGVNPKVHKIAIGDNHNANMLNVSGMPMQGLNGVGAGNTFVLIPNRSGRPGYVQAFPAGIVDDYVGQDMKDIVRAIHNEINRLLNEHGNNPSDKTYNNIKEFLKKLLTNKDGNSALFRGIAFSERDGSFTVSIQGENYFTMFAKSKNGRANTLVQLGGPGFKVNTKGYRTKNVSVTEPEAHKHIQEMINNLQVQISYNCLNSDNNTDKVLKGLVSRENGKFVITIGDKTWTYDSYNEFILKNNLLRLNTKPSADGRSNYNRRGDRNQAANQVLEIKIVSDTTSPVEETTATQPETKSTPAVENIPIAQQVRNILASNEEDKGSAIIRTLIETDELFTEDVLKSFQKLRVLPKNIIFDANFNSRQGYEQVNAEVNRRTGIVTVGTRWMDMFNNPLTRRQAIRKLIHEQLHNKLTKNRGYVRNAEAIYNEFKAYLDNNNVPADDHIRQYLFESNKPEVAIEEFLVESLTSEELANYLNNIDSDVVADKGKENLFQKIMKLLSSVFGWNIRQGSLYEKELNTLKRVFSEEKTTTTETDETTNKVGEEKKPEETAKPKVEVKDEGKANETGKFGSNSSRRMRGKFKSSVTESVITDNNAAPNDVTNIPSVSSLSDLLPMEQRAKFGSLVARGEIETACR